MAPSTRRSSNRSSKAAAEEPTKEEEEPNKRKRASSASKKKDDGNETSAASTEASAAPASTEKKPKKEKAPAHQVLTERDEIPKLWSDEKAKENGSYTFKICSWNVAGLRALLNKMPNALAELATKHNLDVLCLQETKLQEMHLDDPKLGDIRNLLNEQGYDSYFSCSTEKKGYSGTAVFVKRRGGVAKNGEGSKKQKTMDSFFGAKKKDGGASKDGNPATAAKESIPIDVKNLIPEVVEYKMGVKKHDGEGRMIIVDMPLFSFCNVYVPNSGQGLVRLSYRTEEWDKDMLAFMQSKQKAKPILWLGDLNVAHTNLEVWNDGAKHLAKQAGVTAEERASFQSQLDSGFVDAFRRLHLEAKGHYSYWSMRAGNRAPNKGLRLDYFICDPSFFDEGSKVIARDTYMDFDQMGSDHCPVLLELEIKP